MKNQILKDKVIKKMLVHLENQLGIVNTGNILAILCDCFDKYTKDGDRGMRTFEIKINDFFSFKFDFENKEVK